MQTGNFKCEYFINGTCAGRISWCPLAKKSGEYVCCINCISAYIGNSPLITKACHSICYRVACYYHDKDLRLNG